MLGEDLIAKDALSDLENILKDTLKIMEGNIDGVFKVLREDAKVRHAAFRAYNAYIVLSRISATVLSEEKHISTAPYYSALVTYINTETLWALLSLFAGNYLSSSRTLRFLLELCAFLSYVENTAIKLGLKPTIEEAILALYLLSERGRFQFTEIVSNLPWPDALKGDVRRLYKDLSSLTHPTSKHFTETYPPNTASAWMYHKPLFLNIAELYVKVLDIIAYGSIAGNIPLSLTILNDLEKHYHVNINELKNRGLKYTYMQLRKIKEFKERISSKEKIHEALSSIVLETLPGIPKLNSIVRDINKKLKYNLTLKTLSSMSEEERDKVLLNIFKKLAEIFAKKFRHRRGTSKRGSSICNVYSRGCCNIG